jgi:hypothetical protein
MGLRNVSEAWSILQQEIENQSGTDEQMGTIVKGNQTPEEIRNVRRDPKAEAVKSLAEDFLGQDNAPVALVQEKVMENIEPFDAPPVDPRDQEEGDTIDLHDSHVISQELKVHEYEQTEKRGDIKMKKSIRIRKNGDQFNVRVFIGDEEFCGMSVASGSENAISLGAAKLMIQGDETVIEM